LLGATVVFENSPHPSEILRTLKRERATALIAVPRMLGLTAQSSGTGIDARGWCAWFNSAYAAADGEPVFAPRLEVSPAAPPAGLEILGVYFRRCRAFPETEAFFKRIGYAVVQGYGNDGNRVLG